MNPKNQKPRKLHTTRRGSVTLEFALVLPVLVMLLLGIIEFSRALQVGHMVTNVAREGARQSIVTGSSNSDIEDIALDRLQELLSLSSEDVAQCLVNITVEAAVGNPDPADEVANALPGDICRIEISVPYTVAQYTNLGFLNSAEFLGVCAMRHE